MPRRAQAAAHRTISGVAITPPSFFALIEKSPSVRDGIKLPIARPSDTCTRVIARAVP